MYEVNIENNKLYKIKIDKLSCERVQMSIYEYDLLLNRDT